MEYVFDGTVHVETSPSLGAARPVEGGRRRGGSTQRPIVRTSWVGDGKNFIKAMASLADRGISPRLCGPVGRLTFHADLWGIIHLLTNEAPASTTCRAGSVMS